MDIQDDAGRIEAVPSESKEKTRGRSKKKGRRKRRLSSKGSFVRLSDCCFNPDLLSFCHLSPKVVQCLKIYGEDFIRFS